ncbi:hypothetical protein E0L36_22530 [Streptomyces sp. AJS327]|uniref:hypothetical protein n=1 Tax=Streptomyces sp. AJS327 TaxID=2545265 RepID=UPI0017F4F68E|nr:hypothetical protein [Streptomyces sp. AJS327]MBA0053552.1 hypothetical protein [Streptomyces sp. AJS327]
MSFDAEWAGLVRQAAERSRTQTNLAAAEGDESGSTGGGNAESGKLRSHRAAWTAAGESVGDLSKSVQKALTGLEREQKGLGPGSQTGGTECGAAQRDVYTSWKRYLERVSSRCETLRDRMTQAGGFHHDNEEDIRGAFAGLTEKYRDTPEVGGQDRGR